MLSADHRERYLVRGAGAVSHALAFECKKSAGVKRYHLQYVESDSSDFLLWLNVQSRCASKNSGELSSLLYPTPKAIVCTIRGYNRLECRSGDVGDVLPDS